MCVRISYFPTSTTVSFYSSLKGQWQVWQPLTAPKIFCCQFFYLCFPLITQEWIRLSQIGLHYIIGLQLNFLNESRTSCPLSKIAMKIVFCRHNFKSHALSYFWLCYREKSFFSFPRNIFFSETACLLLSKGKLVLEVYVWAKVNYQLSTARQSRLLGGFTGYFSTSSSPRPSPIVLPFVLDSARGYISYFDEPRLRKNLQKKKNNKKSTARYTFWLYNSWDSCDAWWTVPAPPT